MTLQVLSRAMTSTLLRISVAIAPEEKAEWATAMFAEGECIEGHAEQLGWALGALFAIARARIAVLPKSAAERPIVVNAACLYWGGFSAYLIGAIVFQIVTFQIHGPWTDAIVPVILMLALSAFPAVVAFGLWLLDDSARLLCMAFCFVHAMSCFAWMSRPGIHTALPSARIVIDFGMIFALNTRAVCNAFSQRDIDLQLGV